MSKKLSRRQFIRMSGASVATIPFLRLARARAQGAASARKNLISIVTAHGHLIDRCATGSGRNFSAAGPQWESVIRDHRDVTTFIRGIDVPNVGTYHMHEAPSALMVAASPIISGRTGRAHRPGGPSMDYFVASQRQTSLLSCGVNLGGSADAHNRVSSSGRDQPISPEQNPLSLISGPGDLFAGVTPSGSAPETQPDPFFESLQSRMRRAIDVSRSQAAEVYKRQSNSVKQHLDVMLDSLSDLRNKYGASGAGPMAAGSCAIPALDPININLESTTPARVEAFREIIVNAIACGVTSVATLQLERETSNTVYRWVDYEHRGQTRPVNRTFHDGITHELNESEEARRQMEFVVGWYGDQYSALIADLKARQLLDSTVTAWLTVGEHADRHTCGNNAMLISGGGNVFPTHGSYITIRDNSVRLSRTIASKVGEASSEWSPGILSGTIPAL